MGKYITISAAIINQLSALSITRDLIQHLCTLTILPPFDFIHKDAHEIAQKCNTGILL
jgi:hypothetical protein